MADFCSVTLGFGGVTHGDSDGEPTCIEAGSTESAVVPRMASVALPMGLTTAKPSVAPMLMGDGSQQDDIVVPQLALVALPIGMATAKLTTAPTLMVLIPNCHGYTLGIPEPKWRSLTGGGGRTIGAGDTRRLMP
jgi:hypothetical protein